MTYPDHKQDAPLRTEHVPIQDDASDTLAEDNNIHDEFQAENHVLQIARTFSRSSAVVTGPAPERTPSISDANPFLSDDPRLDPESPEFNAKFWASTLLQFYSNNPVRYPRHTTGVSYRDVGVHGFGSPTDYQKDVLNLLWSVPSKIYELISQKKRKIQILRNMDGLVKSGEMLLVLGRPGSGVSTTLKTIAGQTYGLHLDEEAHFNYQGIPWDMMHKMFRGEIIYQAETDVHFPQLTVGQTLMLPALARTPKNRFPGVSRQLYAQTLRDVVMTMFGIYHVRNTNVGSELVRGVSGGERKRVSIAEATLNLSTIQCWDNSTRGLDSATALQFAKIVRLSTELGGTAAIVAMYQASQASYDVFDKVSLLYEGRQIYFGPKDSAKEYFTQMGYHCPDRQTTADFLTSLTNPAERIVKPGFGKKVPRTPDEFYDAWAKSETRAQLLSDIARFEEQYPIGGQEVEKLKTARNAQKAMFVPKESPYTISVPMQIQLCMVRGFQRIQKDMTFVVFTVGGSLAISLVLGSVFYNLPDTAESMNSRCILLYFSILFNALKSALEIFSLYAQRPIVEKQARYALYHPFSEAIASTICDLPTKVLSTIVFNIPLYFMANLRRETGPFFIFMLFGFMATLTMSMIIRTIGQVSRSIHQALTPTAILILALIIYAGFILPTQSMQYWLRWLNYLDPIAYAYESLVANEFSGRQFPCSVFVPSGPPYSNATAFERTCTTAGAAPGSDFVSGDLYINAAFGYYRSHVWRNFGILIGFSVFFMMIYTLAAEYISISPSKGEILVFRRGHQPIPKEVAHTPDEESGDNSRLANHPVDTEGVEGGVLASIQRQESVLHWRDVCYEISIKGTPRNILTYVDGWVKPGSMTALMGATGAGKTTLLDVLSNRVTVGVVSGDILVNGIPRNSYFHRKIGYVQQQDLHLETCTVRESLQFSAILRQPKSVPEAEKLAYVEDVIRLMEMGPYADAVVGVPGQGLNVEQRKRLTIGVELVAKPELLLFLDEPTSGLDSQTAWAIATLIKKLSQNGQAILCTVHQPSAILFQQFDRLLLLARGGKTVYFGDIGHNSQTMTAYFEGNGALPCGPEENPADWMLQVIGTAPGAITTQDWHQVWLDSPEYLSVRGELSRLEESAETEPSIGEGSASSSDTTYASTFPVQLYMCTKRVFEQYWRTPSYIYSKLILSGGTSIFIGVSFYKAQLSISGLQGQMFAIFMLLVVFAFLLYQTMPHFILQRELFEVRERFSKTYSWYVFILSNIIVELPWNTIAALLVFLPFYYLVGMEQNAVPSGTVTQRGGLMFFLVWTFMIFESTFTDMVIAGLQTAELGAIVALLFFAMCLIFCGVLAAPSTLPSFWIFMYRVSPFTYLMSAIMATGLAGNTVECSASEVLLFNPPLGMDCITYMTPFASLAGGSVLNPNAIEGCQYCLIGTTDAFLATVVTYFDERWRNLGIVWAFIAFNVLVTLAVYWLARVPKNWSSTACYRSLKHKGRLT